MRVLVAYTGSGVSMVAVRLVELIEVARLPETLEPSPLQGFPWSRVDSRFKCDTELTGEGLQGGLEGEAFAGRGVEGPEQGVEVMIAVT